MIATTVVLPAQAASARKSPPRRDMPPRHNEVRIEFLVEVPPDTPEGGRVFVSGNHPRLGNWRPDGLELHRVGNREYHGQVDLPRGANIEFKLTRGRWHTTERSRAGDEIANRRLFVEASTLQLLTIEAWPQTEESSVPAIQPFRFRRGVW